MALFVSMVGVLSLIFILLYVARSLRQQLRCYRSGSGIAFINILIPSQGLWLVCMAGVVGRLMRPPDVGQPVDELVSGERAAKVAG